MRVFVYKCPFCGGAAELSFKDPVYGGGGWQVQCIMCKATIKDAKYTETIMGEDSISTPITTHSLLGSLERVLTKWNKRTGDTE